MLLAIDVGNTNTVLGVFDAGKLRDSFRVQTEKDRTGDEYGLQIKALFDFANLRMSDKNDAYMGLIIRMGGEAMGRSQFMPPWGAELTDEQMKDLVAYLRSINARPKE